MTDPYREEPTTAKIKPTLWEEFRCYVVPGLWRLIKAVTLLVLGALVFPIFALVTLAHHVGRDGFDDNFSPLLSVLLVGLLVWGFGLAIVLFNTVL